LPVLEYSHAEGIAVIGGYVYHGSTLTGLNSKYIYGDYGSGKVWALQYDGAAMPVNTLLSDTNLNISSFGVDENKELYFCSLDGKIYVLRANVPESPSPNPSLTPSPNPTQPSSSTPTPSPPSSPIPSQSPLSSPSPQGTPTPKPPSLENPPLLYAIIIAVAFASTVAILFILKKRRRDRGA